MAADKGYLQHLTVTMVSILLTVDASERLNFVILSDGSIKEEDLAFLNKIRSFELRIIPAHELIHRYMTINLNSSWSDAVYYRLILPYVCADLDKIIYLDCDIIVRASLSDLWCMHLKKSVAGVVDTGFDHAGRLMECGVRLQDPYLNSGVIVLNLDRIRSQGYETLLEEAARRLPNPEFPDQDWINLMFESDKLILPPKWNAMSHFFSSESLSIEPYTPAEIEAVHTHPKICHFTNIKPWTMSYNEHPYWFEYWECLKKTPYRIQIWRGYLKKIFLSNEHGFFFQSVRPILKRLQDKG